MTDLVKLRRKLRDAGLDAAVILSGVNRRYVTGFPSTAGIAVVTENSLEFYTDARYFEAAEKAIPGARVRCVKSSGDYEKFACQALVGCAAVGMEETTLSYAAYTRYDKAFEGRVRPLGELIMNLRAEKTPEELERIVNAQRIAEKALEETLPLIRPGITEREIAAELTGRMLKMGAEKTSFDPIVISGSGTSVPHGATSDNAVKKGDFLLMDFGARYMGYCSDMTRTVCIGEPTDEMRHVYNIVLSAQLAGIENAAAGVPGKDIHNAAHQVISDAGYGEFFTHNFSHGLGLEIHEAPRMSLQSEEGIPAGAVISAEPGIYLPGKFGVRIEDILHITPNGCDNLTLFPKELIIL